MAGGSDDKSFSGSGTGLGHGGSGRSMGEINDRVAVGQGGGKIIPLIDFRGDRQFGILRRAGHKGFSHAALRAVDQKPDHCSASRVLRTRIALASDISQSGSRTSEDMIPRSESPNFAGTGLGSMKRSLKRP